MKKISALLFLLLFITSAYGQVWFKGSFEDAQAKARSEGKMVLIDFFSGG